MKTSSELLEYFNSQIGQKKRFATSVDMARFLKIPTTQATKLYNFLKGSDTQYKTVIKWFNMLGGSLNAHTDVPQETARDVCFVNAKVVPLGENQDPPVVEDYMAVPLVDEVGAGPGIIPQGELLSWFLVYKHQDAVRYRRNLVAVKIGKNSTSMEPLLHPGDVVLVDLDDKNASRPGRIMLVMSPGDGGGMIKRVAIEKKNADHRITYYSDNAAENPPMVYSLREDFGKNWNRVIAGHVVWAWSDVSNK